MGGTSRQPDASGTIEVAAGIITDARGRVLLTQRLPGTHLAGSWEFPGGKLEAGESVGQALARELREELDIQAQEFAPLISIPWHYPRKTIRLHALRVTAWRGEPRAREGHALRWVALRDLDATAMPAADAPVVTALRLPPYYVISADAGTVGMPVPPPRPDPVHHREEETGAGDALADALWQLRMPGAERGDLRRTAQALLGARPALRERLLVNHDIELARTLGVGVHLRAAQLRELRERPLPRTAWIGASCHAARELELAAAVGADFATLSPVLATASHPESTPLGWKRFAELVADARLPVYALGGVGPRDLGRARAAGAHGVAGIRAFAVPR